MTVLPLDVRSQDGTVTGTVELDAEVFGVEPNVPLMHQVVTAQLAAARAGTQSTKTRAEVSGGGAKPYRQKGTGRARQGSTRAPHYAGGGVALGPKPRSYRQRTPRKMVQLALKGALSDRAGSGQVAVVDGWTWPLPSTKDAQGALGTLGLSGRVLIVLSREDERAYKSFRNLPAVDLVLAPELAAYDVLCSDWVVFTRGTLPGNSTWGEAPPGGRPVSTEAEAPEVEAPTAGPSAAEDEQAASDATASDLGPDDAEANELATDDLAELRQLDTDEPESEMPGTDAPGPDVGATDGPATDGPATDATDEAEDES
jgi:large subunit ribosomal protein L4